MAQRGRSKRTKGQRKRINSRKKIYSRKKNVKRTRKKTVGGESRIKEGRTS